MVALTITIGVVVLIAVLVAAARSLRRASAKIDTILREELDPPDGRTVDPGPTDR
jgi:hypothetical protein